MKEETRKFKYPGIREAMDGNTAVVMCEREASDAAGAYPITPSTQMGEYWAEETAAGHINVSGRPLIFIEPEGEHAAAAVTAGLSMTGLRACNFSSGQGIAYMHESLYAAVGKRLTYVLNMGCRAMTKSTLNVHAGHDDYHAVDDTGFFQFLGKNVQEVSDLNIIAHKIAELALNPGIVGQDGFLTTHLIESLMLPERELIAEYLGKPEDIIETPTPAQRIIYGPYRRRIPELWDVDNAVMAGVVQNQDSYMQSVAAQRPFFFDHITAITDQCMDEFYELTGRRYHRVSAYRCEDAEYILIGQGSCVPNAEAVADYLRETRNLKVGVINLTMFRPFPGDLLGSILKGRKGVCILERCDQPLAVDLPVMREVRATINKCFENAKSNGQGLPFPDHVVYESQQDFPALYSASFGMGSRDLQPEALIGAVENMLPGGKQKKMFYLSVDFIHEKAFTPKQEIYQQQIEEAYPGIKDLAVRGSENPNLMPKDSITVRFHSVGGWGAIATGKNLAMTLFELLGYHIKANPKYGSEKKGQPTTYYLSAAPEPIRLNSEYYYVDVVLSPDPNVFSHSNPLAGLKKGGIFIIQSEYESPETTWINQIPPKYQRIIIENEISVFCLDGFKIAREVATDPELQFRMQGIAFMGAFFAASPVAEKNNLSEQKLFDAIEAQLEHKFGSKGRRIVEDNLTVVRRGFTELYEIKDKQALAEDTRELKQTPLLPEMLKHQPKSDAPATDIHRFWEQTGNFYLTGKGNENLVDPFISMSLIPASTGVFRDMTQIRNQHPQWVPENCTGCGACWSVCPDSAIPGLVSTISDVLNTAVTRIQKGSRTLRFLPRNTYLVERKLHDLLNAAPESANVKDYLPQAIEQTLAESSLPEEDKAVFKEELNWLLEEVKNFQLAKTTPFYTMSEKGTPGSGGLLSVTIDPYTCKGCMECVAACEFDALRPVQQTTESVATLRKSWDFWMDLPNTKKDYIRIDNLDEAVGALETMLLDKEVYKAMVCGDGACLGCGEKTIIRLFVSTVEALMQPRTKAHVEKLSELIEKMEKHIRLRLAESMDIGDAPAVEKALAALKDRELTLSNLTQVLENEKLSNPIDPDWLKRVTQILGQLKHLKWKYTQGLTGSGRSTMGMINSTGCTSVWGSTYPYNPYPFPWANHLFQDSPSMAMGVFEGHMAKMAEGFKAIRKAELELENAYNPSEHDTFFTYFNWKDFTDEEFLLCPPVVAVGGDGALYDIGFQNLSRLMISGKPVKVICLDTQVYSNTGGQACTSGFFGQVSDMAQFGKAHKGKEEIRKEIGLIGMGHRTTYIAQCTIANTSHLIESFIQGLNARRPALFNVYAPCMPEHGIGDDAAQRQSKLAVESRAYPIFRYNPDNGVRPADCFDLDGNPAHEEDWPVYTLKYTDENGNPATMDVPLTFADFAVTEGRFRKHFKTVPREAWNENMTPVSEFLKMEDEDREGLFPYVWVVDRKNHLSRVIVSNEIVKSAEDRRNLWHMLRALAGIEKGVDTDALVNQAKSEVAQKLTTSLLQMAGLAGVAPATGAASAPGRRRDGRGSSSRCGCGPSSPGARWRPCSAKHQHRGMHLLRRVHEGESGDVRVQRQETSRYPQSKGRHVQGLGKGGREMPGPGDQSRSSRRSERERRRQAGQAG